MPHIIKWMWWWGVGGWVVGRAISKRSEQPAAPKKLWKTVIRILGFTVFSFRILWVGGFRGEKLWKC